MALCAIAVNAGACLTAADDVCSFIQIPGANEAAAGNDMYCGQFLNNGAAAVVNQVVSSTLLWSFRIFEVSP